MAYSIPYIRDCLKNKFNHLSSLEFRFQINVMDDSMTAKIMWVQDGKINMTERTFQVSELIPQHNEEEYIMAELSKSIQEEIEDLSYA